MLAWSLDWSRGITHDHVTDHVVCRHNFILETSRGAVNIRTPTFPPYENLWCFPIGLSPDCAITGYKYVVHSLFSEPLLTVNWPTFPMRNSLPLSSHHVSGTQFLLWKNSKTTSKLVLGQLPHHLGEKFQTIFRLQNCLSCKSSISRNYLKTSTTCDICNIAFHFGKLSFDCVLYSGYVIHWQNDNFNQINVL